MGTFLRTFILLMLATGLTAPAAAFKMGKGEEYQLIEDKSKHLNRQNQWVTQRVESGFLSFGKTVHEDMTEASKDMAQRPLPVEQSCGATTKQIDALLTVVPNKKLGNSVCCAGTAQSRWCRSIDNAVRYSSFSDTRPPLIAGVRWNDDPCHMTQRPETILSWAAWMVDQSYEKYANFNYSSHYHDKQFLHSMASTGFGRKDKERRSLTSHKIMTWSEFAFRVAEGSIPASMPLSEVTSIMESKRKTAFDGAFGSLYKFKVDHLFAGEQDITSGKNDIQVFTVGHLFAGTRDYDSHHVRQLALGALLHTVQDSFSASHVQREYDTDNLAERGRIVHFMDYRLQNPLEHGKADVVSVSDNTKTYPPRPHDRHPVSLGARLIACAAVGSSERSAWNDRQAKGVITMLIEPVDEHKNPIASGGSFGKK